MVVEGQRNLRILIVAGDESIHSEFRAALEVGSNGENHEVDFTFNKSEALEKVKKAARQDHPYQLAFISLQTSTKKDVFETVEHIERKYPKLQVVICASLSDTSWKKEIGKSKWSDKLLTLALPVEKPEIGRIVSSISEKSHLRDQLHQMKKQHSKLTAKIKKSKDDIQEAQQYAKKMEITAEKATKFMGRYLANISHEIRTPLNAIIGFSEGIIQTSSIGTAGQHARIILDESEHLLSLINEMLDHAKIEAGKIDLEHKPLDMSWLLESVISATSVLAKNKELKFNISKDEDVPQYINGDPLRIRQILMNLVNNAVKFTDQGSITIHVETVKLEQEQRCIRFSIIDTGIGIPKEKQKMVFDSFTQVDSSSTRKFFGTGLGTSISKQLVEMMDGQIGLESELDKGSTFWFTIPYDECNEPTEDDQLALLAESHEYEPELLRKLYILVVEDYLPNQEVAKLHLENSGHRIDIACDGKVAVDMCEKKNYDLVLMDVQMPVMDGYEATRIIRSEKSSHRDIPILGLTANAEKDTQQACLEAGMDNVITKPIRRKPLLNAINKLVSREDDDSQEFSQSETMKDAMEKNDMESLRRESHSIKGGAATLEAMPISELAKQLEELSKANKADDIPDVFGKFIDEFERLREFVGNISQVKKINS